MSEKHLLKIKDLQVWNKKTNRFLLKNINFIVPRNRILGVVGESGSGKTLLAKSILGLNDVDPGIVRGEIYFYNGNKSENLLNALKDVEKTKSFLGNKEYWYYTDLNTNKPELKRDTRDFGKLKQLIDSSYLEKNLYGNHFAMIFQDPKTYIYPYWSINTLFSKLYKRAVSKHEVDLFNLIINDISFDEIEKVRYVSNNHDTGYIELEYLRSQEISDGYFPKLSNLVALDVQRFEESGICLNIHLPFTILENGKLFLRTINQTEYEIRFEVSRKGTKITYNKIRAEQYIIRYPLSKIIQQEVDQILNKLHLGSIKENYPNRVSGGQGQRLMISLALALKCDFIVADEPTTGLDVSVQSDVIQFFKKIKQNKTIMLISHDLYLMNHLADYLLVVYNGEILEFSKFSMIEKDIQVGDDNSRSLKCHPYTEMLFTIAKKDIFASLDDSGSKTFGKEYIGCVFFNRCESAKKSERCYNIPPPYIDVKSCKRLQGEDILRSDHYVRCWGLEWEK